MPLSRYKAKRNFKKTSEPVGKKKKKTGGQLIYIIQKHAASHLHYDLRLKLNGVLKSWAVPKGPSLDPNNKRLAVHVEDHPMEYASFEGIIPAGEYGGGTVMIWDKGKWEPQDDNPNQAYRKGGLTFLIKGKKLKGLWKLVQFKNDHKNWLLIKIKDKFAKSNKKDITETQTKSVVSKLTMDQITKKYLKQTNQKKKLISLNKKKQNILEKYKNKIKKIKIFELVHPQLATLVKEPPQGCNWLHEIKFDGYRLLAFINHTKVKLITRNLNDWTNKFPNLKKELKHFNINSAIFDGELVAINEQNEFDFQLLQNSIHSKNHGPLLYYIFDIIYLNGYDLSSLPLLDRKKILKNIIHKKIKSILYSDHIIGDGKPVYEDACRMGLEGIVSKSTNSPYIQQRTRGWLKTKCTHRQEFVIGGFTQPHGERAHFGSLLLGVSLPNNKLQFCGHVGTGFTDETLKMVSNLLKKYKSDAMPFETKPPGTKSVSWVVPKLIAEVEFRGWTQRKILRQASFKGLRSDKLPKEVTIEKAQPVNRHNTNKKNNTQKTSWRLTNPDKILYPEQSITKLELAEFYDAIHKWILPCIINRPLTLLRCPSGHRKNCFYQKHLTDTKLKSIYRVDIKEKNGTEPYFYIKNKDGLMNLVQLDVLEIHPWGASIDDVDKPNVMIFDLDPGPDIAWKTVIQAARLLRDELKKLNLISFIKTTGGKGLHVVIPIKRKYSWDEVKTYAHVFVKYIVSLNPDIYIDVMSKSKRKGKIYIDYLRNQRGATAIAPYSTRARSGASVATPLAWEELSEKIKSDAYTIKNLPKRLAQLKEDPWKGFFELEQELDLKL